MPDNRTSHKASILDMLTSSSDNPSAEAVWRQALLLRELAKDDRTASKERRAEAVAARAQAEHDAITATKQVCAELQSQARVKLQQAADALAHAQRVKAEAEAKAQRLMDDAQAKYEHAEAVKREADSYAEEIRSSARAAADALLAQARAGSQEIANRMRQETAEELRRVLADIEVARAAAQDELETQRILTETSRIRAFSQGVAAQAAATADEVEGHNVVRFSDSAAHGDSAGSGHDHGEHTHDEAAADGASSGPGQKPAAGQKPAPARDPRWGHPVSKVRRRKIRKVA